MITAVASMISTDHRTAGCCATGGESGGEDRSDRDNGDGDPDSGSDFDTGLRDSGLNLRAHVGERRVMLGNRRDHALGGFGYEFRSLFECVELFVDVDDVWIGAALELGADPLDPTFRTGDAVALSELLPCIASGGELSRVSVGDLADPLEQPDDRTLIKAGAIVTLRGNR
ncbi:hypothetical protein [Nocardia thailandica]